MKRGSKGRVLAKKTSRKAKAAISPLTDPERAIKSSAEFRKAGVHLAEAELLAEWGKAPNACVHSAYYAMHHCAVAALLATGGVGERKDVPLSHEHVIQHFGALTMKESGFLKGAGMMLSRARTERVVADYDLGGGAEGNFARELTGQAREFLDACDKRWQLSPRIFFGNEPSPG